MKLQSIILSLLLLTICSGGLLAKNDPKYPVSAIPEELLEGADAVLRFDSNVFEVKDKGHGVFKTKWAYTILNKNGKRHAELATGYDKLKKINLIKGTVYDAFGREVDKLKNADIKDQSAVSGSSLFDDNRMKVAELTYHQYPYTVEFELEVEYEGLMFYRPWFPHPTSKSAVEFSYYEVIMPEGLELRYKEMNFDKCNGEIKTVKAGKNVFRWEARNLKAYKPEGYTDNEDEAYVLLAPSAFSLEGFDGDLSSWDSYGKFIYQLWDNRQELSPEAVAEIQKVVSGLDNEVDKIKAVYKYLQENTRYVSIQLGIGGWQPFPASLVAEKGYGDCKALVNYTHALLKEVGIKSHVALVKAGDDDDPILTDFPSAQFNHVILCVPQESDTIWLECTSQTEAFNYLGDFTDDRDVLLFSEEGGKIVRTPAYDKHENLLLRVGEFVLDEEGNAKGKLNNEYHALQEGTRAFVVEVPKEDQKEWLYEKLDISTFDILDFNLVRHKDDSPYVEEAMEISIRKCASKSGKRLFLRPNLLSKWDGVPKELEERKNDVYLSKYYDFIDIDTMVYQIPENYHLESGARNQKIESDFGLYESKIKVEGNKVTYTRRMEMNSGRYSKESYVEFRDFLKKVNKADKKRLVFVNKT